MFNIKITKEPIVLIDCSYYIFYRYFATTKWINYQLNKENINFLECFEKHFNNDLKKITKKFNTTINNVYFAVDCFRNEIWRNEYLNSYKKNRIDNCNFDKNIFEYFKNKLVIKYNLKLIYSNKLEADDIIAIIHKKITNEINTIIITNDSDYVQLKNENTLIFNMQFKDITIKHNIKNYAIYKALIGDKADNIKRVGKITKINANNLINKPIEEIYIWLEKNNLMNEFNNNIRLIDFNYIPKNLVDDLLSNIKII